MIEATLDHARRLDADNVKDASGGDPASAVKHATGGGADGVLITSPSSAALAQDVVTTRKRRTRVPVGRSARSFPVPLSDVVANCTTAGSFVGSRQDMAEALAFAAGGRMKVNIELQSLSTINETLGRLERGKVPSRVVIDLGDAQ